jgi:hypothetical protein
MSPHAPKPIVSGLGCLSSTIALNLSNTSLPHCTGTTGLPVFIGHISNSIGPAADIWRFASTAIANSNSLAKTEKPNDNS